MVKFIWVNYIKLSYFTNLNSSAMNGDDSPNFHHDSWVKIQNLSPLWNFALLELIGHLGSSRKKGVEKTWPWAPVMGPHVGVVSPWLWDTIGFLHGIRIKHLKYCLLLIIIWLMFTNFAISFGPTLESWATVIKCDNNHPTWTNMLSVSFSVDDLWELGTGLAQKRSTNGPLHWS